MFRVLTDVSFFSSFKLLACKKSAVNRLAMLFSLTSISVSLSFVRSSLISKFYSANSSIILYTSSKSVNPSSFRSKNISSDKLKPVFDCFFGSGLKLWLAPLAPPDFFSAYFLLYCEISLNYFSS